MFILAGNAILIIFLITSGLSSSPRSNTEFQDKIPSDKTPTNTTTPTATPIPTPLPTITFTSTPTPTPTPTPIPTIAPTSIPTAEQKQESNIPKRTSGDIGLSLMNQINDFRSTKGLPALSTDGYTCAFATLRAGEIVSAFNHDGFRSRIDSGNLPYPSYSNVAENIAMNSDPNDVVTGWINSPGHNENMSKNVSFGCVGKSGDYYAFEAWQP